MNREYFFCGFRQHPVDPKSRSKYLYYANIQYYKKLHLSTVRSYGQYNNPKAFIKHQLSIGNYVQLEGVWALENKYIYWNDPMVGKVMGLMVGRSFTLPEWGGRSMEDLILKIGPVILLENTL